MQPPAGKRICGVPACIHVHQGTVDESTAYRGVGGVGGASLTSHSELFLHFLHFLHFYLSLEPLHLTTRPDTAQVYESTMSQPITLYAHSTGPNPWKVAIMLEELGISYKTEMLEFPDLKKEPFEAKNPNGRYLALSSILLISSSFPFSSPLTKFY